MGRKTHGIVFVSKSREGRASLQHIKGREIFQIRDDSGTGQAFTELAHKRHEQRPVCWCCAGKQGLQFFVLVMGQWAGLCKQSPHTNLQNRTQFEQALERWQRRAPLKAGNGFRFDVQLFGQLVLGQIQGAAVRGYLLAKQPPEVVVMVFVCWHLRCEKQHRLLAFALFC